MNPLARCCALSLSMLAGVLPAAAAETDVEVRFHPPRQAWSHPLESQRQWGSVLVQNTAVVNHGKAVVTIDALRFELLQDGQVVQSQFFDAAMLDSMARRGGALAESGMLQLLKFQFAPDQLFGTGVTLSGKRQLAPGSALYVPGQLLAFAGTPQQLRVTAELAGKTPSEASGALQLHHGGAPGRWRFPLSGRWFVAAGATLHSHHRWAVPEEFALDLLRIGADGLTHRGNGRRMQDYYAYGMDVLAAADGEVVTVRDDQPDNVEMLRRADESAEQYLQRLLASQGALLAKGAIAGNHVILRHEVEGSDPVYSVYAHLQPDSVAVEVGQQVRAGTRLGGLGGSGNSTEPHLHFHLCDAADALHCNGLPVQFEGIELPFSDGPRAIQSGDIVIAGA